jgi:PAS domain-containing protein
MEVLCAQAGIALDNAALHARLTRAGRVLDATFDQLPLGLILLGPDLTVLRASPLALTITGLPIVPGMPLIDLFNVLGPTDTAGTPLRFQPALAAEALTTQPIQREMIIVQPSGHRLGLSLTAAPLRDPADALVGVMLLLAEIPN